MRTAAPLACALALLLGFHAGLLARADEPAPPQSLHRLLAEAEPPLVQYRALRMLWGSNEKVRDPGWIEVWTELDPVRGLTYEIVAEGGSGQIRRRALERWLKSEQQAVEEGDFERAAFSLINYRFEQHGRNGDEIKVLMTPRRQDGVLLDGALYLSARDGDLVRVEGRPVRPPSFWTRRVTLVRHYRRIGGVRVPVQIESVAHVRLLGHSEFRMTFQYEAVNGVRVGSPVARAAAPARSSGADR
jgi:hypothetical protein